MKKITLLIVLSAIIFSGGIAKAQRYNSGSVFELKMWNGSNFTIEFDNQRYNIYRNKFVIDNLRTGRHSIKVIQRIDRSGRVSVLYRGYVDIQRNSRVLAVVSRYNNLDIIRVESLYDNSNHGGHGNHYLPALSVPQLRNVIASTPFESDKRSVTEQALASHSYTANDVLSVLRLFSFESTKLKLAKYAYQNCIDKENYYQVNSAFSFSSSIRELNNYIGSYRSPYYDNDWRDNNWNNNYHNNHGNNNHHGNNYNNNNNYNNDNDQYNDQDNNTNIHR